MTVALGASAYSVAVFHLMTHAFFKALLFLAAGSVIMGLHHNQDIRWMGGVRKYMPITWITSLIGTLALIGTPFFSGFYSKEEILAAAWAGDKFLFAIACVVALLTSFYMTRAFVVTFLGKTRSEDADHAHEVKPIMWIPLAILAVMAIASAFLTAPLNAYRPHEASLIIVIASVATLVIGAALGFILYNGKTKDPLSIPLFRNRFYLDSIYEKGLVKYLQDGFAAIVHFLDELLINGLLVGGFTRLADSAGRLFTKAQSGNLQAYAFTFGLGVLLVIYFTVFF
jgi:NADH-quinone oxidoreductase subunit L